MKNVVLFDFNNLAIRTFFVKHIGATTINPDYSLWRFMVFDNMYKSLFRIDNVGEIVVAVDDHHSWRKIYWERYKESRKTKRDTDMVNWNDLFRHMDEFLINIRDYIPFKVLKVKNAEADDTVAVICMEGEDKYHIISTDEDYLQLSGKNVIIYNPRKKEEVSCEDPEQFVVTKCLTGQSKDDIFNIKTPLDWGLTPESIGKRKPGFGPKSAEKVLKAGYEQWLTENNLEERFHVNQVLIDFRKIPKVIRKRVMDAYRGYELPEPDNFYHFCKLYGFRGYLENFSQFENTLLRLYQ